MRVYTYHFGILQLVVQRRMRCLAWHVPQYSDLTFEVFYIAIYSLPYSWSENI